MKEQLKALVNQWRNQQAMLNAGGYPGKVYYDEVANELESTLASSQWVPVTERLPTYEGFVFVRTIHDVTDITYHLGDLGWGGYDADEITHWHAIEYPEPPQAQP